MNAEPSPRHFMAGAAGTLARDVTRRAGLRLSPSSNPTKFRLQENATSIITIMVSRINSQFSIGVHLMTALGDHHGEHVTSAQLTASVRAHESQVRAVLSKLARAGLVAASRGRNGFSSLSRPANKISLLEIYNAVAAPPVFSIHAYPKEKTCRTSCTHKEAMTELLEDTQRAFETRLGQRKLSEMVAKARSYK
jgi:Rrf2 family protein